MPKPLRAALALLVLNLSITSALASTAEDETVRTLTEQYGRALVAGDLDAVRNFWNPKSPNLVAQLRSYKNVFAHARLEFISPQVTRLEVTGDKAVSQ